MCTASIYEKLKQLLDIISTAETPETFIEDVQTWIDSIDDLKARDEKIERHPVGVVFFMRISSYLPRRARAAWAKKTVPES